MSRIYLRGFVEAVCRRRDGSVAWRERVVNGITYDALNKVLYAALTQVAQSWHPAGWYWGLIDSVGYTAISQSDVMSSHAGWVENTAYLEGNRQAWLPGTPANQTVTSTAVATLTASADSLLKGAFLVDDNTKGNDAGSQTLWMSSLFTAGDRIWLNGQILQLNYICNAVGGEAP